MKLNTPTIWKRILVCLIAAVFTFTGCSDDNGTQPGSEAPEIPPLSTFQMSFADFPSASPKMAYQENWTWASLNVFVWQTLVTVGMIVPAAAFLESFNHDAVRQPGGGWAWTYTFTPLGGVLHTARLTATVDNSGVQWEMFITKEGEYSDFLWYSGWCDLFLTEGNWTLNNTPTNPTPWIGIEWHRNPDDSTADIRYTNIIPDHQENGGYIFFGTTTDTMYDAFYEIYNHGKDNRTDIQWNRTIFDGQVRDSLHFEDNDWHCWDSTLVDILCP